MEGSDFQEKYLVEIPKEGFRCQTKIVHLTYFDLWGDHDMKMILEFIRSSFPTFNIEAYSLVSDKSEALNIHIHALIAFDKRLDFENYHKLDYKGIHPNIKKLKSVSYFKNIVGYHLEKEDAPKLNENVSGKTRTKTWNPKGKTLDEIKSRVDVHGDISTLVTKERLTQKDKKLVTRSILTSNEKLPEPDVFPIDCPLISYIYDNIKNNTLPKKITWIADLENNLESIAFIRYATKYMEGVFVITPSSSTEISKKIYNYLLDDQKINTIIFNIPHESACPPDFFNSLKCLTSGFFTQLGNDPNIEFDPINVIIFTNYERTHKSINTLITVDGIRFVDPSGDDYKKYQKTKREEECARFSKSVKEAMRNSSSNG